MTEPNNKAELLHRMDEGWGELLAFIGTLTPEQKEVPTDAAGWTVKDHLIHLAVWQDGVYEMLNGNNRVEAMGVPQEVWNTRDFDQINAVIQQRHKDDTLDEVMQTLYAVHDRFHAKVGSLSEEEFQRPNPDSPMGTRIIDYIIGDSYDHYASHIDWMRAIAESGRE